MAGKSEHGDGCVPEDVVVAVDEDERGLADPGEVGAADGTGIVFGLLLDVAPFVAVDDVGGVREEVEDAGVVEVAVGDDDVCGAWGFLPIAASWASTSCCRVILGTANGFSVP
jgi:hypothetical protein